MARKLIVEILGDSKSLERSFTRSTAAANKFGRDVDTGVGRAEARFSKFQKVAAGGFVGGLIAQQAIQGIRSVVTAAAESQQVLGQTSVALEATGKSWADYGKQIQDTVKAQSQLGFDDEALLRTFSLFQRQTGDVTQALKQNNLAMDVARARFIDLEQAANLVNKAALGQAGALRRLGIDTKGATTGTQLLTLLTEKYGGAAQAASKDATTALDRVAVSTENAKESIGTLLLPAVVKLADALVDAAEASQAVVAGLQKIADFPAIHKIITFEIVPQKDGKKGEGVSVGDLFTSNIFDIAQLGVDAARGTGPFAPKDRFNENAAAKIFSSRFDTFIESLHKGQKKAAAGAKTKAKARGFGAGLTPEDLFGPLIKGVTPAQEEALLDAQLSGNQKRLRAVLVRIQSSLSKAVADPDPRLRDVGRRGLKNALLGVKSQIASIDSAAQSAADAVTSKAASAASKAATKAEAAATEAKRKQRARFDLILQNLTTTEDAAEITTRFIDDINIENKIQAAILKQIKVEGRTAELVGKLADSRAKEAKAVKGRRLAKDFKLLGLGPTGEEAIPGKDSLKVQFDRITRQVGTGTIVLGGKLTKQLAGVAKLLARSAKSMAPEVSSAIQTIFDAINDTVDKNKDQVFTISPQTQALNKNKIVAGLGLDRDTERLIKSRLQGFNAAGRRLNPAPGTTGAFGVTLPPIHLNTTVNMDGQKVAQGTSIWQGKNHRSNPRQKRGPWSGGGWS